MTLLSSSVVRSSVYVTPLIHIHPSLSSSSSSSSSSSIFSLTPASIQHQYTRYQSTTSKSSSPSSFTFPSSYHYTPLSIYKDKQRAPRTNDRAWHLFDAKEQVVGRMAGHISRLLMGKHKSNYHPSKDNGDHVVVVNTKYLKFTGRKWDDKLYRYHTGYPGGLKEIPASRWRERYPNRILEHAIAGMIQKNSLRIPRLKRLHCFPDAHHPYHAYFKYDHLAILEKFKEFQQQKYHGIQDHSEANLPVDKTLRDRVLQDRQQSKGKPPVIL